MQQASLTKCLSKTLLFVALPLVSLTPAQDPQPTPPNPKSLQLPLSTLQSAATFQLSGQPDWLAISEDAVWVSNGPLKAVQRIAADTNEFTRKIDFPAEPCSGLVFAFGTLWVPLCGDQPAIARVSPTTNKITAILPFGPADDEGGITANEDSIWLASGKPAALLRIDPATNTVRQKIAVPPGCANPLYADGVVWVSCGPRPPGVPGPSA